MNHIFTQIDHYMHEALQQELPEVKTTDLEKDGAVFYMNGKNGTAFDWYVNDHLPGFFIFYNDKENLGAVKATLYSDGNLSVYVYGERGHAKPEQLEVTIEAEAQELYRLAALLTKTADEKRIWDADIHDLDEFGDQEEKHGTERPEPDDVKETREETDIPEKEDSDEEDADILHDRDHDAFDEGDPEENFETDGDSGDDADPAE